MTQIKQIQPHGQALHGFSFSSDRAAVLLEVRMRSKRWIPLKWAEWIAKKELELLTEEERKAGWYVGWKYPARGIAHDPQGRTCTKEKCLFCGKIFWSRHWKTKTERKRARYCSRKCAFNDWAIYHLLPPKRGKDNPNWKGGISTNDKGYKGYVCYTSGPHQGRGVHAVIAEKALGRKFRKGEVVHHVNCNKRDNRNCNLIVCRTGYHRWLHEQMARRYAKEHFTS